MTRGIRKWKTAAHTISSLIGELWETDLRKWAQEKSNAERAGIRPLPQGALRA